MNNKFNSEQQQFIKNNNSYEPNSTFYRNENNSARLEDLNDMRQFNYQQNFTDNKPINKKPDFTYKNNTLDENIGNPVNKDTITEYRLNIDSIDRDIELYPDPFQYKVTFGPIVNSGISSLSLKEELKAELKRNSKTKISNNPNIRSKVDDNVEDDILLFGSSPNFIINYENRQKKIFNPYISRDFINIKFIRLDNIVLPRFSSVIINTDWKYCNNSCNDECPSSCGMNIKDDLDRHFQNKLSCYRYIPNVNDTSLLFTDRFIMVNIPELSNRQNLATNPINDNSFTVFPDKVTGILYYRGNPYYAVKIYQDTALGNINTLTFTFYDSWGNQIKLNTNCINYEYLLIKNTTLINPSNILYADMIETLPKLKYFFNKFTEYIKCIVTINYNINNKIIFYCNSSDFIPNSNSSSKDVSSSSSLNNKDFIVTPDSSSKDVSSSSSSSSSNSNSSSSSAYDCNPSNVNIRYNETYFVFTNIFKELNEFVTTKGFVSIKKLTRKGDVITVSIDEYINNIYWYDFDDNSNSRYNLEILFNRYKYSIFNILDKLKNEVINLPLNKIFQNHSMFVMGVYETKLNTLINFRP
jgi:hypothetical protein